MITVDRNHNNAGKESRLKFAYSRKVPVLYVLLRKNLNFLNSVTETVPICGVTDGRTDEQTRRNQWSLFRQLCEPLKRRRLGDKERRHKVRRQFLYHTLEWRSRSVDQS